MIHLVGSKKDGVASQPDSVFTICGETFNKASVKKESVWNVVQDSKVDINNTKDRVCRYISKVSSSVHLSCVSLRIFCSLTSCCNPCHFIIEITGNGTYMEFYNLFAFTYITLGHKIHRKSLRLLKRNLGKLNMVFFGKTASISPPSADMTKRGLKRYV